jgi:hypothetical protein
VAEPQFQDGFEPLAPAKTAAISRPYGFDG